MDAHDAILKARVKQTTSTNKKRWTSPFVKGDRNILAHIASQMTLAIIRIGLSCLITYGNGAFTMCFIRPSYECIFPTTIESFRGDEMTRYLSWEVVAENGQSSV